MATGDDLLLRRSGRELKNTDSVFRQEGQERAEGYFAVAQRKVIFLRAATIVNVGAEESRRAEPDRLEMIVPPEEFLALGMTEIMPVSHDLGWKGFENPGKFLFMWELLKFLPDFKTKPHVQFASKCNEGFEARLDPRPDRLETFLALLDGLDLDVRIAAGQVTALVINALELACDAVGTGAAKMENNGSRAKPGGMANGILTRLDGGLAHGGTGIRKFVAVRIGTENAGRHRTEIMERLDFDEIFLPSFQDARPKRKPDGVSELDDREAKLPDFPEHRVTVLMPVGIPAGGEGQRKHLLG